MIDVKEFATRWHAKKNQRYGNYEYIYHLNEVYWNLINFRPEKSANLQAACYLHDIIEDTECTLELLKESGFDDHTIHIVDLLTDPPGKNRKERKAAAYIRIRQHPDAVLIKLCDRIANVSFESSRLMEMYRKEHPGFKEALYLVEDGYDDIWEHLEGLFK